MESALVLLAVLACPIGMGLMMWFMSKGMMRRDRSETDRSETGTGDSTSLEDLRREQERLSAEIDQLEQNGHKEPDRSTAARR